MPDGYASHLPILSFFASRAEGPVLELGMGYYSTPVLHSICKGNVVSADNNNEWVKKFRHLANDKHEILCIEDWDAFDAGNMYHAFWDVALIDHKPKKRRARDIAILAQRARFIIAHDSQSEKYGYGHVFPTFKHKMEFEPFGPKTMVLSNFEEIPAI